MFKNRLEAGRRLAKRLKEELFFSAQKAALVASLPKGGIVVGEAIAALLDLPHTILPVKKIPAPGNPELAVGAVSLSPASVFLNEGLIKSLKIPPQILEEKIQAAQKEIKENLKRLKIPPLEFTGKTVVLVDDGAATGATMKAAIKEAFSRQGQRIIVALPVAPQETVEELKRMADAVVVIEQPKLFFAVSQFYQDFPQLSWEEVKDLLSLQQKDK
ncbi:phosphoribosyltransferase [bacterium]|nr:phosphoribosyltransferase [bacterium]